MGLFLVGAAAAADENEEEWSDQDIEHMISIIVRTLVISIITYFAVIRPLLLRTKIGNQLQRRQQQQQQNAQFQAGGDAGDATAVRQANRNGTSTEGAISSVISPHNRLVDGIQPFSQMHSERSKSTSSQDLLAGRQLLESLAVAAQTPSISTKRGSVVVVTVKPKDFSIDSTTTQQFLRYLGVVTNLFVILSCDEESIESEEYQRLTSTQLAQDETPFDGNIVKRMEVYADKVKDQMYGEKSILDRTIIPPHRIVACSSTAGRIAFVRQMNPAFVVDFDMSVKEQLTRFGVLVINYKNQNEGRYKSLGGFLPDLGESNGKQTRGALAADLNESKKSE
jgi:hypothetical protein